MALNKQIKPTMTLCFYVNFIVTNTFELPTNINWLSVLSNIEPPLRREIATLQNYKKAQPEAARLSSLVQTVQEI